MRRKASCQLSAVSSQLSENVASGSSTSRSASHHPVRCRRQERSRPMQSGLISSAPVRMNSLSSLGPPLLCGKTAYVDSRSRGVRRPSHGRTRRAPDRSRLLRCTGPAMPGSPPRVLCAVGWEWVLSLPYRLRYVLAWDHDLCRAVVAVYVRALLGFLRRRARRDGVRDGHGGAVAIIQRFGGALNLNVHVHALVIDGVFTGEGEAVGFHSARRLTRDDVAQVVAVVARRIDRLLQRRGVAAAPEERGVPDAWSEDAPVLAGLAAASIHGRIGLGPRAGAGVQRYGEPPDDREPAAVGPCHAQAGGFDLHAAIMTRAGQRDRLERLCRYALRPACPRACVAEAGS